MSLSGMDAMATVPAQATAGTSNVFSSACNPVDV